MKIPTTASQKKLDWQQVDEVIRYDLKSSVKRIPFLKIFRKLKWNHLHDRFVNMILKNYLVEKETDFTNNVHTQLGKIKRDKNYLKYKEEENKYFIQLDNVVFWIKLTDVFWIGDISDYGQMNESILAQIKKIAFRLGYNTIVLHLNKSLDKFPFLKNFKQYETEPLCFYYINKVYENTNLLITGADFDTW